MRRLLVIVVITIALPLVSVVFLLLNGAWPEKWDAEHKAALVVGVLGVLLPIYATGVKSLYDEVSAGETHNRDLIKTMFNGFEEYSRSLLFPLQAIVGDLSIALLWDFNQANNETKQHALYCICRYTEAVSAMRIRYTRIKAALPQKGLFLADVKTEELIWRLLLEPSAFGVPKGAGESIAVDAVRRANGELLPVFALGEAISPSDFRYVSDNVFIILADNDRRKLLSQTMTALNVTMDWAILNVLKPWYGKSMAFPDESFDPLRKASKENRAQIGLNLPQYILNSFNPHLEVRMGIRR